MGLRVAYQRLGSIEGPKVLGLHGWLDNSGSLQGLANRIPNLNWTLPDLPGHGQSQHRGPEGHYHFAESVAFISAMVNLVSLDPVILVGHSLGAALASIYAGTFPERVSRLVLLEGLGSLIQSEEESPQRLRLYCEESLHLSEKKKPVYGTKELAMRARLIATPMNRDEAMPLLERGLTRVPGGWTWATDQRLRLTSPSRYTEPQVREFLKRIQCPVLLIRGNRSQTPWSKCMDERAHIVKNLVEMTLPGNHHIHLDAPTKAAEIIQQFLGMTTWN